MQATETPFPTGSATEAPRPRGYAVSRYNRLSHGVMLGYILPSRGLDHCTYTTGCPCHDETLADLCVPGDPCPLEAHLFDEYVASARREFSYAKEWLSEDQFEVAIADLAIIELQRARLSALIAREGPFRKTTHPLSGVERVLELGLAAGRYETAISNEWNRLVGILVNDPREDPANDDA